jgi:hypothetical protein
MMANDELIAELMATHRDGNHLYGPDPLSVRAAQALAAQDALIAELEAEVESLGEAYRYDRERD